MVQIVAIHQIIAYPLRRRRRTTTIILITKPLAVGLLKANTKGRKDAKICLELIKSRQDGALIKNVDDSSSSSGRDVTQTMDQCLEVICWYIDVFCVPYINPRKEKSSTPHPHPSLPLSSDLTSSPKEETNNELLALWHYDDWFLREELRCEEQIIIFAGALIWGRYNKAFILANEDVIFGTIFLLWFNVMGSKCLADATI